MNHKSNKFALIIGLAVVLSFTACNRSKDGTATETANPETDFEFADGTITGYIGTATTVVIPSQIQGQAVTAIGNKAFLNKKLISVTIPSGVTSIGGEYQGGAFAENQLTSITIPNSVTSIDAYAFDQNQLTSVTIPNSVTYIERGAFRFNQLTSVTIGANVSFGDYSNDDDFLYEFVDAYSIYGKQAGTYTLNNGVWSLSGVAAASLFTFENGTITGYNGAKDIVAVPSQINGQAVTAIGEGALKGQGEPSITIPDSVTKIGGSAFGWAKYRNIITIGANVELGVPGEKDSVFDDDFDKVYNSNGKQAGTYILTNSGWRLSGNQQQAAPPTLTPSKIGEFYRQDKNPDPNDEWSDYVSVVDPNGNFFTRDGGSAHGSDMWEAYFYEEEFTATSTFAPERTANYEAKNLADNDRNTSWCEGVKGYGIGERVTMSVLTLAKSGLGGVIPHFDSVLIVNGYAKDAALWKDNTRVKTLRLYVGGRHWCDLRLDDTIKPQTFTFPGLLRIYPAGLGKFVQVKRWVSSEFFQTDLSFEIIEVYPGDKYDDTCITGIAVHVRYREDE